MWPTYGAGACGCSRALLTGTHCLLRCCLAHLNPACVQMELMALREDCAGLNSRIPELEAAVGTYKSVGSNPNMNGQRVQSHGDVVRTLAAKAHQAAQSDATVQV